MRRRLYPLVLSALATSTLSQAQEDLRDVVELTRGKPLYGRVARAWDADEVTLLVGGKRERIPRSRIRSVTTVNDHLREFFRHRDNATDIAEREWMLVAWAKSRGLESMAQLQALHVLLEEPDHEGAHEFLGHRKRGDSWSWPIDSRWVTREAYDAHISEWGHPLILEGEHFRIRTDAGLQVGVNALLDLEHMYVWWFDTFGEALRPREVIGDLMDFHVHRGVDGFPAWSSTQLPYYVPQPNGDFSASYVDGPESSPALLLQLGSEQLLYNTLADGMGVGQIDLKDRLAAWIDVGLGRWIQSSFSGSPGYLAPGEPTLDRSLGALVLRRRDYGPENMIGLRYARYHDATSQAELHWANTATFVAFLMGDPGRRQKLLEYVELAYGQTKGNSSSLFDKVMGQRIEAMEKPWIDWLEQRTGISASR